MNVKRDCCVLLLAFTALVAEAQAALISYSFSGTISAVSGPATAPAAGDSFSGVFTFDTSTAATLFPGLPAVARYDDASPLLQISSGAFQWSSAPATIFVRNDANGLDQTCASAGTCRDEFSINSVSPLEVSGTPLGASGELTLIGVSLFLISDATYPATSSTFTDLSLPSVLTLDDFQIARVSMVFQDPLNLSAVAIVQGNISSLAPVPLPAAAWLLLSGLGVLGVFGRRKAAY
jgi:hypothetical protein